MLLIREIMYCKPGKVRPMVEKVLAMSKLNEKMGVGKIRVMTDFCAERYWTIVSEFGNLWSADPTHRLRLEITNIDSPYLTPSRIPSATVISAVSLIIPVR